MSNMAILLNLLSSGPLLSYSITSYRRVWTPTNKKVSYCVFSKCHLNCFPIKHFIIKCDFTCTTALTNLQCSFWYRFSIRPLATCARTQCDGHSLDLVCSIDDIANDLHVFVLLLAIIITFLFIPKV